MRRLAPILLALAGITAHAQTTIALDTHASHDNEGTSSATVVVGPFTTTAGDGITCEFGFNNAATFTSVTDNVNSGAYTQGTVIQINTTFNESYGIYFRTGVTGGATTVTLTYLSSQPYGAMGCEAWKPSSAGAFTLDGAFLQYNNNASGANPTTGSAKTPANSNELVIGFLGTSNNTPTAGTNYTLIDDTTYVTDFPEYWIQTTATATNAPYTMATDNWTSVQAAFYMAGSSPGAGLSPTSLSYGNQSAGSTSSAQTTTLTNTGSAALTIGSIALQTGTQFSISANTCGSTLGAGSTCAVTVTFSPTGAGAKTDNIEFTDNASGSPQAVALSGTGVAPGWSKWNGVAVGSSTGNIDSVDLKTVGQGTGNYNAWNKLVSPAVGSLSPALIANYQSGTDNAVVNGETEGQAAPSIIVNLKTDFRGGTNNCAVMMVSASTGLTVGTPTDNELETWTSIASTGIVTLWGVHGTTAGTAQITVPTTGTGNINGTQLGATVTEVANCNGFGGHGTLNTAATGSALNLTLGAAPASGDMVWASYIDDSYYASPLGDTITPGSGFTPISSSTSYGRAAQVNIATTSTTVPITYSGSHTIQGAAVVLKQGSAGTGPPAGKYIPCFQVEDYGLSGGSTTHATNLPCWTGNLIVGMFTGETADVTAVTSSGTTATWSTGVASENTDSANWAQIFYGYNASISPNGTITPTISSGGAYVHIDYAVVANANASPLDTTHAATPGNQTTNGNLTCGSITPGSTGELIFDVCVIYAHTITGMAADTNGHMPVLLQAVGSRDDDATSGTSATAASSLDEDDGRAVFANPSDTNAITFIYTNTGGATISPSSGANPPTGVGAWAAVSAAFK